MNQKSHVYRYALVAAAVLLAILVVSHLCRGLPYANTVFAVIIIFYEIAVPVEIVRMLHFRAKDFAMYAHNIDTAIDLLFPPYGVKKVRPDFPSIQRELAHFAKVLLITFVPYVFLYWGFYYLHAQREGTALAISLNFPPQIFYEIISQIFVIALPEELFYRGFLQSSLLKKWPNRTTLLRIPLGRAIILTNVIFALGHVFATFSPVRILTFFPGLIFSYLAYKNKSILSAILYHAACNILGQILYASFFLR